LERVHNLQMKTIKVALCDNEYKKRSIAIAKCEYKVNEDDSRY